MQKLPVTHPSSSHEINSLSDKKCSPAPLPKRLRSHPYTHVPLRIRYAIAITLAMTKPPHFQLFLSLCPSLSMIPLLTFSFLSYQISFSLYSHPFSILLSLHVFFLFPLLCRLMEVELLGERLSKLHYWYVLDRAIVDPVPSRCRPCQHNNRGDHEIA